MTGKNDEAKSQILERELLKATRPKVIDVEFYKFDEKSEDYVAEKKRVTIFPIPATLFTDGVEALSSILTEGYNEYTRASSVIQKFSSRDEALKGVDIFSTESLQKVISEIPGILKFFIDTGTDIDYEEIEHDAGLAIELTLMVVKHGLGDRLLDFFMSGKSGLLRPMGIAPQSQAISSSSNGDTQNAT